MARTLHIHNVVKVHLGGLMVCLATGCLISPPIESEPFAPERPPRLDFMDPADRNVTVSGPEPIRLSVRAFDENPHDFLDVIWVGEELRANVLNVARQSDILEDGEIEYRFDVIELLINEPCQEFAGVSKETISVYVADASLDLVGNNVRLSDPGGGGFIATFSWILTIQPGACL